MAYVPISINVGANVLADNELTELLSPFPPTTYFLAITAFTATMLLTIVVGQLG